MDMREDMFQFLPYEAMEEIFTFLQPILIYWPILSRVSKEFYRVGSRGKRLWKCISIHPGHLGCKECTAKGRGIVVPCRLTEQLGQLLCNERLSGTVKEVEISFFKPGIPISMLRAPMFAGIDKICIRSTIITNSDDAVLNPDAMEVDEPYEQQDLIFDGRGDAIGKAIFWPYIRVLNLSNSVCDTFFNLVIAPNLHTLVLSGVRGSCSQQMVDFITRSRDSIVFLDVSRTNISESEFDNLLRHCQNLQVVVATELRWRGVEDTYASRWPQIKVIFRLLSHWLEPIKKRREDVACLYDVDGKGCSLLADAIYVGIKLEVIKYILEEFQIDVNRFGCLPPPWLLPYPTKVVESFEQLRAPLGLHQALLLNKFDIASYLVSVGADPNVRTNDGYTAVQCLLHGPTVDASSRNNGILFLLDLSNTRFDSSTVRMCVERQLPLAVLERIAFTAIPPDDRCRNDFFLFCASIRDNWQLCSTLIEKLGADPSALFANDAALIVGASSASTSRDALKDGRLDTSLLAAIRNSSVSAAETIVSSWGMLVGRHALSNLITFRDSRKLTALHYAIMCSPSDRMEQLLRMLLANITTEDAMPIRQELHKFVLETENIDWHERGHILEYLNYAPQANQA